MRYPIHTFPQRRRRAIAASPLSLAVAASFMALTCAAASPKGVDAATTSMHAAMARDLGIDATRLPQYLATEANSYSIAAKAPIAAGPAFAGHWIEAGKDGVFRNVVAIANPTAAARVRALGADVRIVTYTHTQLEAISTALRRENSKRVAANGIAAWHVDVTSNRVVVTALPGRLAIARSAVAQALGEDGMRMVRVVEAVGRPETLVGIVGGERYNLPGGSACSIGFPVKRGSDIGFATAGHCGTLGTATTGTDGTAQGSFTGSVFPTSDMAWVKITNTAAWSLRDWVTNYASGFVDIVGSQQAAVGAAICRSGFRTGFRCGTVGATNVSVNYGGNVVYGLVRTNACVGRGDSGGAYITPAGQAQGVTSGGLLPANSDDNCAATTIESYHQPIGPLLTQFGLTLYTSNIAPPSITGFACPSSGGEGYYECLAYFHSRLPATATWTGRIGFPSQGNDWTDFLGECAARETVNLTLTVRNANGAASRSASFRCP